MIQVSRLLNHSKQLNLMDTHRVIHAQ